MNLIKKKIKTFLNISPLDLYTGLIFKRIKKKGKLEAREVINIYFKKSQEKKLHIGCGTNFLNGWLNTDLNPKGGAIFLDAGRKFPIANAQMDFIYSEHLFEHLTPGQQLNMLSESYRVLKKEGVVRIATPSLDFLFDLYNTPEKKENEMYISWSTTSSPYLEFVNKNIRSKESHYCYVINNFFKAWGHQMIHNFESLEQMALQTGFTIVKRCEVGKSTYSVLKGIEKHGEIIPEEMNLLETMVVELVK